MGIFKPLLPALFLLGAVAGCGDIETSDPGTTTPETNNTNHNTVKILSITPAKTEANVPTDFTIDVEYNFVGPGDGSLDLGFNTEKVNEFVLVGGIPVKQGSGFYSFEVNVTPVDAWSPEPFMAAVYLSAIPVPTSWTPLAATSGIIELTSVSNKPTPEKSTVTTTTLTNPTICYKAEGVDDFCVRYE